MNKHNDKKIGKTQTQTNKQKTNKQQQHYLKTPKQSWTHIEGLIWVRLCYAVLSRRSDMYYFTK